jgi:hypothetical protein
MEEAYQTAYNATQVTQFNYAKWNKPAAARGRKALLYMFRGYMQGSAYFIVNDKGRWRAIALMLALGGIIGVPLAKELMDILDAMGTKFKEKTGMKNPKVDSRKDLEDLIKQIGIDPDWVMNGLSRTSLGLHNLGRALGVPFPAVDMSSSIQQTYIPGTEAVRRIITGQGDFDTTVAQGLTDLIGVAGRQPYTMLRAAAEGSPRSQVYLKAFAPAALKNLGLSYSFLKEGRVVNSQGDTLVTFDPSDPEQFAEAMGQAIGFTPTALSRIREKDFAAADTIQYYVALKERLITNLDVAIQQEDGKAKEAAVDAIRQFNTVVPPEFALNGKQLNEAIRERAKNHTIRSKGLPTVRRYVGIYQNYQGEAENPRRPQ